MDDEERETPPQAGEHEPGEELGERKTIRKHDPHQPSEQEMAEHEMTQIPFRRWCRHCITGTGREEDCRKTIEEERQVPEMHLDYVFVGDETEGKRWHSRLQVKERRRPSTAQCSQEVHERLDLLEVAGVASRRSGVESVDTVVASDSDSALSLTASWNALRAMSSGSRMIIENSPVGSSKSNGIVERAIQSVPGKVKTVRIETDEMSCLFVCHSHLPSITVLPAVWVQACGLESKTPLSLSCIFWTIASATCSVCVYSRPRHFWCVCWRSDRWYPCIDSFVNDSGTGDPQLVAWHETMGKS